MHEIKNLTNSPYDLQSVDGPVRLPAMGSVKAKFSTEEIVSLSGCGLYEVSAVKPEPRKGKA